MNRPNPHAAPICINQAVSTVVGVILIIFLVVTLSGVIYVLIYGLIFPIEKTAYVAVDAEFEDQGTGIQVISLFHRNGDIMQYENLTSGPPFEVTFLIETSEGSSAVKTNPAFLSDTTWSPGDTIYIFRQSDGYVFTDDPARITGTIPFPPGQIAIAIIDTTHHQLVALRGTGTETIVPTETPTTTPTTATPTSTPTSTPTTTPTPTPTPNQNCVDCESGESFTVAFTTEEVGQHLIRFKDASSPQPNLRFWTFGDGGSYSGELIDHTYPGAGSYQITLTVKKNNSPCTCTLNRWITVP